MTPSKLYENCDVPCRDVFKRENISLADAMTILETTYASAFSYYKSGSIAYFKIISDNLNGTYNTDFITVIKNVDNYIRYNYNYDTNCYYNLDLKCNDLFKIMNITLPDAVIQLEKNYANFLSYDINECIAYYKINPEFINGANIKDLPHEINTNFISIGYTSSGENAMLIYVTSLNFMQLCKDIIAHNELRVIHETSNVLLFSDIEEAKNIAKYIYPLTHGAKISIMVDTISNGFSGKVDWATCVLSKYFNNVICNTRYS
jgi:hypothetical protein